MLFGPCPCRRQERPGAGNLPGSPAKRGKEAQGGGPFRLGQFPDRANQRPACVHSGAGGNCCAFPRGAGRVPGGALSQHRQAIRHFKGVSAAPDGGAHGRRHKAVLQGICGRSPGGDTRRVRPGGSIHKNDYQPPSLFPKEGRGAAAAAE